MLSDQKFILGLRFLVREENFGGLAFLPSTGEILQLNHAAYERLSRFLSDSQYVCLSNISEEELSFWRNLVARGIAREGQK